MSTFDYKIDIHGAHVVVVREPLHPACSRDNAIDFHITALKADLDRVAKKMKKAVREQETKPPLDEDEDV